MAQPDLDREAIKAYVHKVIEEDVARLGEEGLALLERREHGALKQHCVEAKSDGRDAAALIELAPVP